MAWRAKANAWPCWTKATSPCAPPRQLRPGLGAVEGRRHAGLCALDPPLGRCLAGLCRGSGTGHGISPDYEKPGGVHFMPVRRRARGKARRRSARMHNVNGAAGYGAEMHRPGQLDARMLPGFGPDVVGGSWSPHDGHASPSAPAARAFTPPAARGGRYHADARAQRIGRDGQGFRASTPPRASTAPARSCWPRGLATAAGAMVGHDHPAAAAKGQILVTERAAPLLTMPTHVCARPTRAR